MPTRGATSLRCLVSLRPTKKTTTKATASPSPTIVAMYLTMPAALLGVPGRTGRRPPCRRWYRRVAARVLRRPLPGAATMAAFDPRGAHDPNPAAQRTQPEPARHARAADLRARDAGRCRGAGQVDRRGARCGDRLLPEQPR